MIFSRPGRMEIKRRVGERLWPAAAYAARAYRLTFGRRARVVAVVGSAGKTTTMRAISAVLGARVSRAALLNMNSHAAVGRALLNVRPWQRRAVLEVAINGPGQMRVQARTVRPDIVVVTAITRDHWQSFGTLEATRAEKADIVHSLPASAYVVLNADDENVRWFATQTRAHVVLAGEAADADVRATDVELDWPHGMRFQVCVDDDTWPVSVRLVGRHMIFPALAALAVAHIEGLSIATAIETLAALEPTPGRMQTMLLPSGAVVLRDEFKGTLDAWDAALETFAGIPADRHFVVSGEIAEVTGNQDYRDMGARAAPFDNAIFVGTSKNFQLFRSGAVAAGMSRERIVHRRNAREVVELLRGELRAGDAVLIRGRWQQALGRVGLALAGRDVQCRADPCPFKRMLCDVCPFLEQPFNGLRVERLEADAIPSVRPRR